MLRFVEDVNIRRRISHSLFSTPREIAYIWQIERVQIDALKFEKTKIHFFSDVFTALVSGVMLA